MLMKFEQTWNFELFDKKKKKKKKKKPWVFYNHFWQWVYVILGDVSVAEIIV